MNTAYVGIVILQSFLNRDSTVLGGDNVPPLVKIGLTDLPKTGGAEASQAPTWQRACSPIEFFIL